MGVRARCSVRRLLPKAWIVVVLPALVVSALAVSGAAASTRAARLMAWGVNADGQLGIGSSRGHRAIPAKVRLPKGTKAVAASAGDAHSLALTSSGSVFAWGYNVYGELGNGTTTDSDLPVKVKLPKGTKASEVAAGGDFSLALTSTGSVLAWGFNAAGALGNGTTTNSDLPVKVKLPKGTKVTAVAAGNANSVALTSTGKLLAWGINGFGQLGNGSTEAQSDVPVKVKLPKGTKVTAVAAGTYHNLALTSTGELLSWGDNAEGQLGNGSTEGQSDLPVKVKLPKGTKVVAVAGGGGHSLALTSTGKLLSWGYDSDGQLGNGSSGGQSDLPVKVELPKGTKVVAVAAGYLDSLALTSTGTLLAWGYNSKGELGNGTETQSDLPVTVELPKGTKALAVFSGSGAEHSFALVG